jgi:endonuclease/exonuclease/phosphatase family metal-dependent hydrolase
VPPWWAQPLAEACGAQAFRALTSRNSLLAVRRALARRWPDALKSNGGGANVILARAELEDERALLLRRWPERRVAQLARLPGIACVANLHASTTPRRAREELARLWKEALAFAGDDALMLGGDLNLRQPTAAADATHVAARDVDHLFVHGLRAEQPARVLDRARPGGGELSDHPPLLVEVSAP